MRSGVAEACEGTNSDKAALPEDSVIIISDDESEVTLGLGNSVLLIEDAGEESFDREKRPEEVLDEEIAITFSKKGNVMPHARYDCMTHPFARVEQEIQIPLEENASVCAQCYCYLCDKPASECPDWTTLSICHCNAHNKSKYWKEQRDSALAGVLTIFNLELTEIDSELREGGNQLQNFINDLSVVYNKFLEGSMVNSESLYSCPCPCHRRKRGSNCAQCIGNHSDVLVHSYASVYTKITEYINKAEKENPKTAAVMLLGAARELVGHKVTPSPFVLKDPNANLKESSARLMARITCKLQRLMVLADYPKNIYEKFVNFYQSLSLPPHFYSFTNSLNILRWDNLFLTSILAGQNVTGHRTSKGKKEFLWEALPVIKARVEKMEETESFRQLVRYLNVVRCSDTAGLTSLRQKICFYMCKYGDFASAALSLLQLKCMVFSIAQTLTPPLYGLYLTMLRTSSCPPGIELVAGDVWIQYRGIPLKKGILVRCAIKILYLNNKLAQEAKCWSTLIRTWCTELCLSAEGKLTLLHLPEPDQHFQRVVLGLSCSILDELRGQSHASLPDPFHQAPLTAELILVVQAVVQFMMNSLTPLKSMLELVLAFGTNIWALALLIEGISPMESLLRAFVLVLNKEIHADQRMFLEV
ncbi:uncharacterized protein WCC33_013312 [Rhinophrynus dorsalis]